jgi:hypothetical protein
LTEPSNPRFTRPAATLFLFLIGLEFVFAASGAVGFMLGHWAQGVALLAIGAAGLFGVVVAASR